VDLSEAGGEKGAIRFGRRREVAHDGRLGEVVQKKEAGDSESRVTVRHLTLGDRRWGVCGESPNKAGWGGNNEVKIAKEADNVVQIMEGNLTSEND